MTDELARELIAEVASVKRLLIFALLRREDVSQADIAGALGTSQSQVSRMMAKQGAKDAKGR